MRLAAYWIIGFALLLGCFLLVSRFVFRGALTSVLGEARMRLPTIDLGTDIHRWPGLAGRRAEADEIHTGTSLEIIEHWAGKEFQDWAQHGKVTMTRVMLAKLLTGTDVDQVNRYLLAADAYAGSGSSYALRPKADYDFAEIVLVACLFLFGDQPDVLWPETAAHILNVLLIERGYGIRWTVPGSLGTVRDTENHILMTEGTRTLRNLWLTKSGIDSSARHVRRTRDHAMSLARYIDELDVCGLYEFNSQPYSGYTLTALLVIHAFAEEPELVAAARRLLDRISYQFAVSSMGLRRIVPFRRHLARANRTNAYEDPLTAAMVSWYDDLFPGGDIARQPNLHHAIVPAAMPYRPGTLVDRLVTGGDTGADEGHGARGLVLIGRGKGSSPEIHYRGDGYMISAGGVSWGRSSSIAARPTVLILADGTADMTGMLRIVGAGEQTAWNNTGVHLGLAVGNGPLAVPDGWRPAAESGGWCVFPLAPGRSGWIVAYEGAGVSLFAVVEESNVPPDALLQRVLAANPDSARLTRRFSVPGGATFSYTPEAPRGTWVIEAVDGEAVDRDYQAWPRLRLPGSDTRPPHPSSSRPGDSTPMDTTAPAAR